MAITLCITFDADADIGGKGVSDPNRALLLEDRQLELLGSDILIKAKPVKPRLLKPKMRKGKG